MNRRAVLGLVGLAAVFCAYALTWAQVRGKPPAAAKAAADDEELAELERRIDSTVRVRGTLVSMQTADVVCEVPGGSTILSIVEDGSQVKKGDVLARLDDTAIKDKLAAHEAAHAAAEAALAQAKATHDLRRQEAAGSRDTAVLAVKAAELAREKYLGDDGEHKMQVKTAEAEIALAEERVKTAEIVLKTLESAHSAGGAAPAELAKARLAAAEARTALTTGQLKHKLLTTKTLAHQTAVLELAIAEAQANRARILAQAETAVLQAEAEVRARQAALAQETAALERMKIALSRCVVHAPRDGFVMFPPRSWAASPAIEVGARVAERQLLMQIPDMSRLGVRVLVPEVWIKRLRVGQNASVHLHALPREGLRGKVVSISNQMEQRSWFAAEVQEYAVVVALEKAPEEARVGMTALAEIDVGVPSGKGIKEK